MSERLFARAARRVHPAYVEIVGEATVEKVEMAGGNDLQADGAKAARFNTASRKSWANCSPSDFAFFLKIPNTNSPSRPPIATSKVYSTSVDASSIAIRRTTPFAATSDAVAP